MKIDVVVWDEVCEKTAKWLEVPLETATIFGHWYKLPVKGVEV